MAKKRNPKKEIEKPEQKANTQQTPKSKLANFGGKANSNGFDKRPQDAVKGGRVPSIKKELAKVLQSDGIIIYKRSQVIDITDEQVRIKVPKKEALANKMLQWAMSNKSKGFDALKYISEMYDGKPVNMTIVHGTTESDFDSEEEKAEYFREMRELFNDK